MALFRMIKRKIRPILAAAFVLVTAGFLASCYLPNNFVSEIRLGKNGDFAFNYKGNLIWAPLFRDIAMGKVPKEEIPGKITRLEEDLRRDAWFKSVQSLGNGVFDVEYRREGHLGESEQVTFVRRNAVIMMIKASPDGKISVTGNGVKPAYAEMANEIGLNVLGEFHISTEAPVLEHNATEVRMIKGYPVYIWRIKSIYDPSPRFVIQRENF